jgi:dipeptidyl aminopeptidase/acylaminoacyl peptidase
MSFSDDDENLLCEDEVHFEPSVAELSLQRRCQDTWTRKHTWIAVGVGVVLVVTVAIVAFSVAAESSQKTESHDNETASKWPQEQSEGELSNEYEYLQMALRGGSKRPMEPMDLAKSVRVSAAVVSPNQKLAAFSVRRWSVSRNESATSIYVAKIQNDQNDRNEQNEQNDGSVVRVTSFSWRVHDAVVGWSHDSESLLFLSNRFYACGGDGDETTATAGLNGDGERRQLWQVSVHNKRMQLVSDYPLDVVDALLAPAGDRVALSVAMHESAATMAESAQIDAGTNRNLQARVYDKIMVRHWDTWATSKRQRLFVQALRSAGSRWATISASGSGNDLRVVSPAHFDVPTLPFGDAADEWAWSSDGRWLAYTVREYDDMSSMAWRLNTNIHAADFGVGGGTMAQQPRVKCLTCDNLAEDLSPRFLQMDGAYVLAYLARAVPGYESDRQRAVVVDIVGGARRVLTPAWTLSVSDLAWRPGVADGVAQLVATVLGDAVHTFVELDVTLPIVGGGDDADDARSRHLFAGGSASSVTALDSRALVFSMSTFVAPAELFVLGGDGAPRQLTHFNDAMLDAVAIPQPQRIEFAGARNETVRGWLIKPPSGAPVLGSRGGTPLVDVGHGGPQGSWSSGWSYRWNPSLWACNGFAVVLIDFHGSTGYGQPFCDSIRGDYGGAPYEDHLRGVEHVLARNSDLDAASVHAAGASYGGWMVNWMQGHNQDGRFKSFVCHDGIFDQVALGTHTEELWFTERDNYGTVWQSTDECAPSTSCYERWNPANHIDQWQTPMLIIHGGRDYRIPETHALSAFNVLQRRGVESKLLYFPNENHWVLSTVNSMFWHQQVFQWLVDHM